jgi:hypothetical protein
MAVKVWCIGEALDIYHYEDPNGRVSAAGRGNPPNSNQVHKPKSPQVPIDLEEHN